MALSVGSALKVYTRLSGVGRVVVESGYWIGRGPDTVRGPDVSFVSRERAPRGGAAQGFFDGPPDLAVEVVSPSNAAAGIAVKVAEYLRSGARRVWVIYPSRRCVVVHFPDNATRTYYDGETIEDPELLPGFSLPVSEIFDP